MYSTAYILWTFTWFVHFKLPFRLKGTEKIHTDGLSKFHSNIYSILFGGISSVEWECNRKSGIFKLKHFKLHIITLKAQNKQDQNRRSIKLIQLTFYFASNHINMPNIFSEKKIWFSTYILMHFIYLVVNILIGKCFF